MPVGPLGMGSIDHVKALLTALLMALRSPARTWPAMATAPLPKSAKASARAGAACLRCHSSQCHCVAWSAGGLSARHFFPSGESRSPPQRRKAARECWKLPHQVV